MIQVDSNDLEKNMKKDKKTSLKKYHLQWVKLCDFQKINIFCINIKQ